MNETLYEELADITMPENIVSKDLLDEAIDLLIDLREQLDDWGKENEVLQIDNFLNLVDEKNKVMYE